MASLTGQRIAFGQGRHRIATSLGELTVHGLYRRMLRLGRQAVGGPQRRMPQYGVVRDRVKAGFVAAATAPPTEQQVEATLHFLELAARSPGPARRIVENLCHVAHYRTYEYAIHLSRVKGVRRERMLQHDPYAGFDESVRVLNEQLNLLLR